MRNMKQKQWKEKHRFNRRTEDRQNDKLKTKMEEKSREKKCFDEKRTYLLSIRPIFSFI